MTPWHPKPMISNTSAGGSNATVATSATKFQKSAFDKSFSNSFFSDDGDQQMCSVAGLPVRLHSAAHVLSSKIEPGGGWSKFDWITFFYLQLIDRFQGVWEPMRAKNDLQVAFWNSYWKVGHAKLLFEGCLGRGTNLESFGFCLFPINCSAFDWSPLRSCDV